jgi:hypothetical protein
MRLKRNLVYQYYKLVNRHADFEALLYRSVIRGKRCINFLFYNDIGKSPKVKHRWEPSCHNPSSQECNYTTKRYRLMFKPISEAKARKLRPYAIE